MARKTRSRSTRRPRRRLQKAEALKLSSRVVAGVAVPAAAYVAQKARDWYNGYNNRTKTIKMGMPRSPTYRGGSVNIRGRKRKLPRSMGAMAAATGATIKTSPGLVLGQKKKLSLSQKMERIDNPPIKFDSKWTFQMDCTSGRVCAAQIPVMTRVFINQMYPQLYNDAVTDTLTLPPTLAPFTANNIPPSVNNAQYQALIEDSRTRLKFYNSSTNTMRCRLVWYKPNNDFDGSYMSYGSNTYDPLNMLMIAANNAQALYPVVPYTATGGNIFTSAQYTANFDHAGSPLTGTLTTGNNVTSTVATLDPSLVPGSVEVRRQFSKFWKTLKSQDFTLEPGHQFNTSLTLRNKILRNGFDDYDVYYRKDCSIVGVVYVMGQIVFASGVADNTITTGDSQLSVMREDTCTMRPMVTKSTRRVNLTADFAVLNNTQQSIINTQTNDIDTIFDEDR